MGIDSGGSRSSATVLSRVGVAKVAEMEKIRIEPSWMPCANNQHAWGLLMEPVVAAANPAMGYG